MMKRGWRQFQYFLKLMLFDYFRTREASFKRLENLPIFSVNIMTAQRKLFSYYTTVTRFASLLSSKRIQIPVRWRFLGSSSRICVAYKSNWTHATTLTILYGTPPLTAVDAPDIRATLGDRLPSTSQKTINRFAAKLSENPKTGGASTALKTFPMDDDEEAKDEVNYTLGKRYQVEGIRHARTYGNRPRTYSKPMSNLTNNNSNRSYRQGKRLSPSWMRGVKGCFVCGQDHRTNTKHPRGEVIASINRLRRQHPTSLLSVADMEAV